MIYTDYYFFHFVYFLGDRVEVIEVNQIPDIDMDELDLLLQTTIQSQMEDPNIMCPTISSSSTQVKEEVTSIEEAVSFHLSILIVLITFEI